MSSSAQDEKVSIHPNPTNKGFQLDLGGFYQDVTIVIRNTTGQVTDRVELHEVNSYFMVLKNSPGIYFVEIHSAGEMIDRLKVVKN